MVVTHLLAREPRLHVTVKVALRSKPAWAVAEYELVTPDVPPVHLASPASMSAHSVPDAMQSSTISAPTSCAASASALM